MDRKQNILRHLYGEDDSGPLGPLIEGDDALRREYQALSEIKFHLDRRSKQRPDASALEAVFAAAEVEAHAHRPGRHDRGAIRPSERRRMRLAGFVSSALVLVTAIGIGLGFFWNTGRMATEHADSAVSERAISSDLTSTPSPARSGPVSVADAPEQAFETATVAPPPAAVREPVRVQSFLSEAVSPSRQEVREAGVEIPEVVQEHAVERRTPTPVALEWDESGDVRRLQRHIGFIEARTAGTPWSTPARSDDTPSLRDGNEFLPASQLPTDWDY